MFRFQQSQNIGERRERWRPKSRSRFLHQWRLDLPRMAWNGVKLHIDTTTTACDPEVNVRDIVGVAVTLGKNVARAPRARGNCRGAARQSASHSMR
jgi:hypothetical protein